MGKSPTKIVIQESDTGMVFRAGTINPSLVNFYIEQKTTYKDGTSKYNIGMELASNPKRSFILDSVRGNRQTATRRLDQILKNGL